MVTPAVHAKAFGSTNVFKIIVDEHNSFRLVIYVNKYAGVEGVCVMTSLSFPIEYFKKQAKELCKQAQNNDLKSVARIHHVFTDKENLCLARAQHVVAVEHGYIGADGQWIQSLPFQPHPFLVGVKSAALHKITYYYRIGSLRENFEYGEDKTVHGHIKKVL